VNKLLDKLSSIKLAIGLIVYLAVTGILATLVPQGLAFEEYQALYPRLLADLVFQTGFSHFFNSILFILPALLFFANLSVCTVKRFVREIRRKGPKRFGPDILHLGLMLLVLGSIWSYSGHQQGAVTLSPGEGVELPDGSTLVLRDFRFEQYDDGRPKDWISTVDLSKNGQTIKEGYQLKVNAPLRHAGLTLYQASYSQRSSLILRDAEGHEFRLGQGESLELGGLSVFFMAPEGTDPAGDGVLAADQQPDNARAVVQLSDADGQRVERLAPGSVLGDVIVIGFRNELATGIEAVDDPGYPLVLVALILIAFGTALTFIQKLKELA